LAWGSASRIAVSTMDSMEAAFMVVDSTAVVVMAVVVMAVAGIADVIGCSDIP